MLKIRLLTVEDQQPEKIYNEIHAGLRDWLFVKKNLVSLGTPTPEEDRWVTNLADWRAVIGPLSARHDLTFCTVDLKIPEHPADSTPEARHGLTLITELMERADAGVRCCVLTGLGINELEEELGGAVPEVLFDFKGDQQQGFPNILNYIRSQALSLTTRLSFPGPDGKPRLVLLDEESGALRDHYLSRAVCFMDPTVWHIPMLMIGREGLGARTLMEFVSYMSNAKLSVVDLRSVTRAENRENHRLLEELAEQAESGGDGPRRLVYVAGVDRYQPGVSSEEGENCLWSLRRLLTALGKARPGDCLIGLAFSVSGDSRLRIRSKETRAIIRLVEASIGRMTSLQLEHLGVDENGWTEGHPLILHLPSLAERGKRYLEQVIEARFELLGESVAEHQGERVGLTADVLDLLLDKTDWSRHGNLTGLCQVLGEAFEGLVSQRAEGQYEITRAHLGEEARGWLHKEVFNLDDVSLSFPEKKGDGRLQVIQNADFRVEEEEFLVILGPSGCGKSTILRLLAGLLKPTTGTVTHRGEVVREASERVGMVFQDYSLFPWLTVRQNVAFGPKNRGEKPSTLVPKIERLLNVSKLTGFEDAYPAQLSGGMRQRVAIIRALANEPEVLLMDEPFGALDLQTRWQMQDFLLDTRTLTRCTVVFVTHDIEEAVFLADRIYIASPRPLILGQELVIPFSTQTRQAKLRRDPTFVSYVNQVRDGLLDAASRSRDEEERQS